VLEQLDATGIEYTMRYLPKLNLSQIFFNDLSGTGVEINFINESA